MSGYFKDVSGWRILVVAGVGIGLSAVVYLWSVSRVEVLPEVAVVATSSLPGYALAESEPVRLRIPEVGIDAGFEGGLGLNPDKTSEVPDSFTEVGWYKFGPTPGELGPAVILGHVDSKSGPAVFWSLGQVEVGDEVLVDRADGSTARFVVTDLTRVDQDEFPTRAVYGDIDYPGLRLITCSGTYDRGAARYTHNLIVYAKLADS
ncbi:class F sortase [Patescibacteria group bacterium]|nr:class F sortase [Patescibacteria group bacterium]